MNSARNTNDEMNSMKIVDETMGEVRRNWNVMTQDDVSMKLRGLFLIISISFLVQSDYSCDGNVTKEQFGT